MACKTRASLSLVLLFLAGCSSEVKPPLTAEAVAARQVTAEGSAFIREGGIEGARREAMNAAIMEATERLRRSNGGANQIGDVKVVDEWQQGDVYRTQIVAQITDKSVCNSPYRKKIVATAFPMMASDQLFGSESQDLMGGLPREISNQLMESGAFLSRNAANTVLYSRPDLAPEMDAASGSSAVVTDVARRYEGQLVLSGVIRDFKIESSQYVRGTGVLAEIKALSRDIVSRRSIGVDVYVHDGFTGALLFQHRYTDSILGDVSLPAGYSVGSQRFADTPAGNTINDIIRQASADIYRTFSCYPFATRVTQVVNNRVFIAAGSQDKVRVGDRFKLYPAISSVYGSSGEIVESQGTLTITEVTSNSAQGMLNPEGKPLRVYPGDWVKSIFMP